ncbi:uncharacterized protein LOC122316308 [Carya illinoinensis]|uniref:uncharacterized protein LOC122316308 n=1 Tax=Carya illinoinensis TaxID=32201 RepID=UPI001C718F05|nr:uncharacterized protein LOC122316308 [Carya illinoinensis]
MRGIICRHILAIFSARKVRELPEKYILDRWRKDIKRRYSIIPSSHDVADQRPETVRYKRLLKICYEVITNACSQDGHTEDMVSKLYAMNDVYCTSKPHKIQEKNVGDSTMNAATEGSSKKVLSPNVVRGKGRPPCKRKMSKMEEQMRRKKKTKAVRKRGDTVQRNLRRELDTELMESSGNQLGPSRMSLQENLGTQESMQLGMDGTQPAMADGTQPETAYGTQMETRDSTQPETIHATTAG